MSTATEPHTTTTVVAFRLRDDGLLVGSPLSAQLLTLPDDRFELRFSLPGAETSQEWLIRLSRPDSGPGYMGAAVVEHGPAPHGQRITVRRGGVGERLLAESGRVPLLSETTFRYERPFSDEVYASWLQAGVWRRVCLDQVLVCPHCHALPTIRFGCQRCSSGRLLQSVLVHHFACAHIGPLENFTGNGSLTCPKCRTKHLVAGTDFEYAPGEHQCQDCGWTARERVQAGHCLCCDARFPMHQAVEQPLEGFHVDRVDALDLVPHVG